MSNPVSRPDLTAARSGREPIPLGDWMLHADLGLLRRGKQEQRLNAKALHVLLVLIDARGDAVSRDQILDAVWGASYPSDAVVSRAIADLRNAFGEAAGDQDYIRTVPKFGYQLVAAGETPSNVKPSLWVYAVLPILLLLILWWSWPEQTPDATPGPARLPEARPLTADPGLEHQPRIAAGGDWVVYAALRPNQGDWDLFRISTLDGASQAVAAIAGVNEHGPAVSPDGDQVAYVRLSQTGCDVVVQAITFGVPQPIARCTGRFPTLVDWSPDGASIAFTIAEEDDAAGYRRLYAVQLATGTASQLSDAVSPTGSDFYPRYSPSGNQLAFLRGEPQPDHRTSIWVVDTATGTERRLTKQAAQLGGMTWLDNETLLYTVNDAGSLESRRLSIDSGIEVALTGPDLAHPEYHVESQTLVAAQLRSERDLALVGTDGTVTSVAPSTSDDHHGVIQPGGKLVAYISRRSGFDEIWLYDLASATARQLTSISGATIRYPTWHPDGLRLLFTVQGEAGERVYEIDVVSGATAALGDPGLEATTPNWLDNGQAWVFGCETGARWGVCIADVSGVRKLADGFFRPIQISDEWLAVNDGKGHLYRMHLENGATELLWDGMLGLGRNGWTIHGDNLYYLDPVAGNNSSNVVHRNLSTGSETFCSLARYRSPTQQFPTMQHPGNCCSRGFRRRATTWLFSISVRLGIEFGVRF